MNNTPLKIASLAFGIIILINIGIFLNGGYSTTIQGVKNATADIFAPSKPARNSNGPKYVVQVSHANNSGSNH